MPKKLTQFLKNQPFIASLNANPIFAKYQVFIIPGAVLFLCLLLIFFITIPQFLKLKETYQTIDELKAKQIFFQDKISFLEQVNLSLFKDNLDTALIALPVERDVPGVIGQILIALSATGTKLETISFTGGISENNSGELGIRMDISGDLDNIKSFLAKIQETPRVLRVNGVDLSKSSNDSRIVAALNVVTFYKPLPEAIGSVEDPVPKLSEADTKVLDSIKQKISVTPQVQTATAEGSTIKGRLNPFQ